MFENEIVVADIVGVASTMIPGSRITADGYCTEVQWNYWEGFEPPNINVVDQALTQESILIEDDGTQIEFE